MSIHQSIDLKNIDRETRMLYAGLVTFGGCQHHHDPNGLKLSDNEALGRLFSGFLLRRIVRDVIQIPERSTDIVITMYPDEILYSWQKDGSDFDITSHDTTALPSTISIGYDNLLVSHPTGAIKTKGEVVGITLEQRAYEDRAQWRKHHSERNMTPYMVISQIAEYINLNTDTESPLINFQTVETMRLVDIKQYQFTVAFDILGRLYTLIVDTN